ncbi:carboxymuconolactone decarboxylase family protein [Streptomyces sp. NPDC020983]|uniref:carboxymuconolactone decarboxylase family protein n=1 Tax=Streptomyces sp. NPDC020983 TaxID=3365106 RepID=UPI0037AF8A47
MAPRFDLLAAPTSQKVGKRFYAASLALFESTTLPRALTELVQLRVSQINGCGYCADVHIKEAAAAGESALRLGLLATWRHTTVFTEAERAALAFAEEGTRIADGAPGVTDATWAAVREHYDEDGTGALVVLVSLANAANRMGVIVHNEGGSYASGAFAALG